MAVKLTKISIRITGAQLIKNLRHNLGGYLASIHDQEIPTKYLIIKQQKEAGEETTYNTKSTKNVDLGCPLRIIYQLDTIW